MACQILITERFALNTLIQMQTDPLLNVTHDLQWFQKPATDWAQVEILVIRSQTKVNQKLLAAFPKLKFIVTATAGFNHIDIELCKEREIVVSHCPSSHTASTAELTWSLILACARRVIEAQRAVQLGDWDRNKILGVELSGKTLGIIGLGRVGSRVAHIGKAFGMNVMAFDPYQEDEIYSRDEIERVSLEELLTQADVVSLHVPLTKETWHMLGEMFLESLSPHAILINTCRGPVIHEKAVVHMLQRQKIGAVGLDVFEYEPLARDSQLLRFSNVITTPHVGASTREAFDKASQEAYAKVRAFIQRETIADQLPPDVAWYTKDMVK
jgi:D-3-phosphoglycerate dehydrogenase